MQKGYSQESHEDIVENISVDACNCIAEINTENNSKNSAIKNCIAASVVKNLDTEVNASKNDVSEIQLIVPNGVEALPHDWSVLNVRISRLMEDIVLLHALLLLVALLVVVDLYVSVLP